MRDLVWFVIFESNIFILFVNPYYFKTELRFRHTNIKYFLVNFESVKEEKEKNEKPCLNKNKVF